ncbi:tetratricopeptide repeat protein [Kitasatospora sp. NBC_00240]|uniref:tetratricopeptide repeat protein n=1 Tax=Kitasatospora sp. NBC_00240 TaxID=2903567 RepID=UPI0022544058|nr:tetratricopeptide repeat protein [Kitasatospora sp. NBC_00240]MCX5213737.1 tetratricopeptide repeat protein [Kitasatospora sp. NBC_00240]
MSLIVLDAGGRMVPKDREALERAVADLLGGPLDRPDVLRRAGVGLLVLGRHDEAVRLLRRASALAGDDGRAVAVHLNLGDAQRYRGDLDAAESAYRKALRLAHAHAPHLLSYCFQHLGKQRLDQGRTAEARAFLEEALRRRRAAEDLDLIASTESALRLVEQAEQAEQAERAEGARAAGPAPESATILMNIDQSGGER